MKRLLKSILLGLMLVAPVSAGQLLKQSTATQVDLKFVDATDGVTAETALTVTTFDCNLIKHADSGMTNVALTVTTAGGGGNDAAHIADGIYSLELTATDTGTLGRLDLYCQCSGAVPFEMHYTVAAAEVYDSLITDIGSIDDYWEYATASIGTAGGIGLQLKTNVTPHLTVPRAADYADFTFEMVDATDGVTLETGLTVTCNVSKDGAALAACTNGVTEIGSGLYKTTIAAADLTADEVWLRFTAAGARRVSWKLRTQR